MTRTNAREIAAHLLYAIEYTGQPVEEAMALRLEPDYYKGLALESDTYQERPSKKQRAYIHDLVKGVVENREALNRTIGHYSVGWNINRISKLSKTFMQIALYECLYLDDVPNGVAINEAVNLTKTYDEESAKFVNGILGSFVRGGCKIIEAPAEEPAAEETIDVAEAVSVEAVEETPATEDAVVSEPAEEVAE